MEPSFRSIPKEALSLQVPPELADLVRAHAAKHRLSVSAAGTRFLSAALGVDPRRFGLEPVGEPARAGATS